MPAPAPSRRRALCLWLALTPVSLGVGCLTIPEDLEDPEANPAAPSSVQELLDRHVAASGGAEALRGLAQRTSEARVVFKAQEGCDESDPNCVWEETTGQFVLYTTADGRMYRRMVVGDNVLERGFDGTTGWQMQAQPQMLVIEDPAATPVLREDALLHWYFDVAKRDELALELLPARKRDDGGDLDGILWFAASPAMPQSEKWFDRATGLLYEEVERDTENGDVVRRVFTDYREVDGVQIPWLIEQITEVEGYPDNVVELRMQVIDHRPVKDALFAVPELAPTEPEPDQLLLALDQAKADAEANADDALAQVMHARVAFAAVHFAAARAASERALKIEKNELEALYILARIHLLEGDLKAAEKRLKQAKAAGLRDDEAARQQAWIHLRQGAWDQAAKDLEQAGSPDLSARYSAFTGKPLQAKMGGNGCTTEVVADRSSGAAVIEVEAEGETLTLLFDTGASDMLLSDSRARSLVIGTDAEAPLVAGGPPLKQGQLDTLKVGDLSIQNIPVTMIPDEQMGGVVAIDGVDGVIGIRPFANRQLTVGPTTLTITEPSKRCAKQLEAQRVGPSVPFWVHETHYIYVMGAMNEAEGVYLLNTGMRGADLTANEGAYAYAGVGAPAMQPGTASLARIARFALGDWSREDLGAAWGFLQQNATTDGFRLDGMLGMGALPYTWTLDYDQQRIYLRLPADEVPAGVPGGVPGPAPKSKPKPKSAPKSEPKSEPSPN